jgi:hypothetical protein
MANRPLCETCRWNEIRRFLMGRWNAPTEGRGCAKQIALFPLAESCERYEREPGTD